MSRDVVDLTRHELEGIKDAAEATLDTNPNSKGLLETVNKEIKRRDDKGITR